MAKGRAFVREENCTREKCGEVNLVYDKDNLYSLMRTCGRYLYLRSGKGAGQGRILAILMNRKKMTQKELQDILRIQPGSMSEILAKLEEKGLIRRGKDDEDKRRCILELTDAGAEAARLQEKQEDGHPTFGVLKEAEQEELKKLLGKLLEYWLGNQN